MLSSHVAIHVLLTSVLLRQKSFIARNSTVVLKFSKTK